MSAPGNMHARDCAYVTEDGPAPCTCGYWERNTMSKPLLTHEELQEAVDAQMVLRIVIQELREKDAPAHEVQALQDMEMKLGQGVVLCADPWGIPHKEAVAANMRRMMELVLSSQRGQELLPRVREQRAEREKERAEREKERAERGRPH